MNQDSTLFQGTATYYSKYRTGYAAILYAEIQKKIDLTGTSHVLDIGTGTGTIAHTLASHVQTIYALDPSEEMLLEAKRVGDERELTNIMYIHDSAENIDSHSQFKNLDLVTFGASFHWVKDMDTMLLKVARTLEEGGWIVIMYGALAHIWTEDPKNEWKYEVTQIIKKYLGEERRAGEGYFKNMVTRKNGTFEQKLLNHKDLYTSFCRIEVSHTKSWSPEQILGFLYSTSFARREYFGIQITNFENDVYALFKEKGMNTWTEEETHIAILAQNKSL